MNGSAGGDPACATDLRDVDGCPTRDDKNQISLNRKAAVRRPTRAHSIACRHRIGPALAQAAPTAPRSASSIFDQYPLARAGRCLHDNPVIAIDPVSRLAGQLDSSGVELARRNPDSFIAGLFHGNPHQ